MDGIQGADAAIAADQHQYLTFLLGNEQYGIEILRVQEIKGYTPPTPIPNMPPHVQGVMNLRGTVVPVLDLRLRFGMQPVDHSQFTVVIVVTVNDRVVGLVVDAVSDVLSVPAAAVVPPPDVGEGVDTSFLTGMVRSNERLTALLAIDRVVGMRDLERVAA